VKTDIKSIIFFVNGNTAVFDKGGKQVPELQVPWLTKFLRDLQLDGYWIWDIDITLPNNRKAEVFNTTEGISWNIV